MKYKLICYGCGKATNKGYHVLSDDTIYHYCLDCLEDVKSAKENEEIQAMRNSKMGGNNPPSQKKEVILWSGSKKV